MHQHYDRTIFITRIPRMSTFKVLLQFDEEVTNEAQVLVIVL